jgi:hypothetical protein
VTPNTVNGATDDDFIRGVLPSGSVRFAAGETSKTITVYVQGDSLVENDEGFTVTLSNQTAGTDIAVASATGTIIDDDASVSISAVSAHKAEGAGGVTPFTFNVTRTGNLDGESSVRWTVGGVAEGDSAAANDFAGGVFPRRVVRFAAGESSQMITVNVAGDRMLEADEGFTVTLSGASRGTSIGTATANGVIVNDDSGLSIEATTGVREEGNRGVTPMTFTVTRTGNLDQVSSAKWDVTLSDGATADDFAGGRLPRGLVSFGVGETSQVITVYVAGDREVEGDESYTVTLSAPSRQTSILVGTATGTILNDDVAGLRAPSAEFIGSVAYASSGLDAPVLSFIGVPDLIDLGSEPTVLPLVLEPANGVDLIAGFDLGQDELAIDLMGMLPEGLLAADTTVNGVHAISLYASTDPAHGAVLVGMPDSVSAADLLASHTRFAGGFAIVG